MASIIEDLNHIRSTELAALADYVHKLREDSLMKRKQALEETAGSLAGPEGDAFEAATKEFDHIDEDDHGSW